MTAPRLRLVISAIALQLVTAEIKVCGKLPNGEFRCKFGVASGPEVTIFRGSESLTVQTQSSSVINVSLHQSWTSLRLKRLTLINRGARAEYQNETTRLITDSVADGELHFVGQTKVIFPKEKVHLHTLGLVYPYQVKTWPEKESNIREIKWRVPYFGYSKASDMVRSSPVVFKLLNFYPLLRRKSRQQTTGLVKVSFMLPRTPVPEPPPFYMNCSRENWGWETLQRDQRRGIVQVDLTYYDMNMTRHAVPVSCYGDVI